ARRDARARLAAAGLLGRQAVLRPPRCPLRVGVVAPPGKGLEDFLEVLGRSPWAWTVRVVTVTTEGPDAPPSIAAAIARLRRADLVVVTRGGGSAAVAAYDSFEVCRAVCASPAPVIVAVGHSSDASLADECAFASAATPTAAGEVCVALLERADAAVGDVVGDIVARGRACLERALRELTDAEKAVSSRAGQASERAARAARAAAERSRRTTRLALVAVAVLAVAVIVMLVSR
ncbi:MAG: hypothetical protein M3256_00750, partial [Actinomycetota bacterium]|nr:hypothetical protein [Actinomycetota bacterium]